MIINCNVLINNVLLFQDAKKCIFCIWKKRSCYISNSTIAPLIHSLIWESLLTWTTFIYHSTIKVVWDTSILWSTVYKKTCKWWVFLLYLIYYNINIDRCPISPNIAFGSDWFKLENKIALCWNTKFKYQ